MLLLVLASCNLATPMHLTAPSGAEAATCSASLGVEVPVLQDDGSAAFTPLADGQTVLATQLGRSSGYVLELHFDAVLAPGAACSATYRVEGRDPAQPIYGQAPGPVSSPGVDASGCPGADQRTVDIPLAPVTESDFTGSATGLASDFDGPVAITATMSCSDGSSVSRSAEVDLVPYNDRDEVGADSGAR